MTMTQTSFQRAQEIERELIYLKDAIIQINQAQLFKDRNACSGRRIDDPFLCSLEAQTKNEIVIKLNIRITHLEMEFDKL